VSWRVASNVADLRGSDVEGAQVPLPMPVNEQVEEPAAASAPAGNVSVKSTLIPVNVAASVPLMFSGLPAILAAITNGPVALVPPWDTVHRTALASALNPPPGAPWPCVPDHTPGAGLERDGEGDVLDGLPDFPPQLDTVVATKADATQRLTRRTMSPRLPKSPLTTHTKALMMTEDRAVDGQAARRTDSGKPDGDGEG
jgi:hypothetical protein